MFEILLLAPLVATAAGTPDDRDGSAPRWNDTQPGEATRSHVEEIIEAAHRDAIRQGRTQVLAWGNEKGLRTSAERIGEATQRFEIDVRRAPAARAGPLIPR